MPQEQYQLTDAKLVKQLFDLIETGQALESITVTELCLKSGVSRKTFYRHYGCKLIPETTFKRAYNE
ncbi:TetR/AcrR family transcriptional regulator [Lactiplantibacillus plantarum]|uniref:TetR/AcrR family transcriptional regulator n=1 Tax=Lactiplantibacillus plantarum TaxID=1590 RepID=UPI0028B77A72|nr:TetR/AcrR family transcriptional regulator [Lactiplantibacillus plantarum]MDT7021119.1 TetR/AcrR family transcriptional regulator [Lactiplantibacillus plantarum]